MVKRRVRVERLTVPRGDGPRPQNALENALQAILDSAIFATNAQFGNIQLRVAEGALCIAVQRGFKRPFLEFFGWVLNADDCACGLALGHAERIIVEDVRSSSIFSDATRDVLRAAGALAVQSTPLVFKEDGAVVGMLSTHYRTPSRPLRRQLAQVDALAERAAALLHFHSLFVSAASRTQPHAGPLANRIATARNRR